jgi:hypothetical protein
MTSGTIKPAKSRARSSAVLNRRVTHGPTMVKALVTRPRHWAIGVVAVPLLFSVLGSGYAAEHTDSGLAGCTALLGTHQVAAADYPKIGAQFAGSRWPDLRSSGLAYVDLAAKLHSTHAYGGETVWFYQRLSTACANHGQALPYWPS